VNFIFADIGWQIGVAIDGIKSIFQIFGDLLAGDYSKAWSDFVGFVIRTMSSAPQPIKDIWNSIANGIEGSINFFIDSLNTIINAYNSLPDWAKPFGAHIDTFGHVTINLPTENTANEPRQSGPAGCFVDGTMITMADGSLKAIEKVQINDAVKSFDPETGDYSTGIVSWLVTRTADTYKIILQDNTMVECSGEHPFYMLHVPKNTPTMHDGRFVQAKHLRIGMKLVKESGEIQIKGIIHESQPVRVHNFNVEPCHTYIAGGILVHNRKFAEGGVFMQPTYLTNSVIAEREPEAIIPLSKLGNMQAQELTVNCPIYLDSNKVGAAITKKIRLNAAI
jgi:hypothetical protein